jgi:hypothetical protein
MRRAIVFALSLIASTAVWSQGSNCGTSTIGSCVESGGLIVQPPGSGGPAALQCMPRLAQLATDKLRAQLLLDKAVTKTVMDNATITEAKLGAACEQTCATYNMTKSKIHWAKASPGQVLGSPGYLEQLMYKNMLMPAMPGKAELEQCMPAKVTKNWCPTSGSGIGAGPTRTTNPLDKLEVCATAADVLTYLLPLESPVASNCARSSKDAKERITAENDCLKETIKANAAAAAAANKAAAVYSGPAIGSTPAASTVTGGARTNPNAPK